MPRSYRIIKIIVLEMHTARDKLMKFFTHLERLEGYAAVMPTKSTFLQPRNSSVITAHVGMILVNMSSFVIPSISGRSFFIMYPPVMIPINAPGMITDPERKD